MGLICVFGASITYGAWDFESQGWVNRLRKSLDKRRLQKTINSNKDFMVYNLGVSGDTTTDLLERFEAECKARYSESVEYEEEFIIIFSIGINDTQFIHDRDSIRTSEKKFKENIKRLIDIAKNFTPSVIFTSFTPVDDSKTAPIPWNTNKSYKMNIISKYNGILESTCKENKIPFIDVFNRFLKMDYKKLTDDGLHPNSKGHEKISEIVKKFLTDSKVI